MKLNKLTVGITVASAMMLGISQAQAFDKIKWKWNLDVDTNVTQDIDINVDFNFHQPDGLAVVEVDQHFAGDLTASSTVKDVSVDIGGKGGKGGKGHGNTDLSELGSLVSNATAVANNISIESGVMTNLDVGQVWDGSGSILATSYVKDIDNLAVDSVATAVANNLSFDLATTSPGETILLANIEQSGIGSVSAYSTVRDVTIGGVSAGFEGPYVNSVATAVGNNVSISVGSVGN